MTTTDILKLYKPPFRYTGEYIEDSEHLVIATPAVFTVGDKTVVDMGETIVQALNEHWERETLPEHQAKEASILRGLPDELSVLLKRKRWEKMTTRRKWKMRGVKVYE